MTDDISDKIKDHTDKINNIYKYRKMWLYASSFVYLTIILIIVVWDVLIDDTSRRLVWAGISVGLVVSVNWWYWTMKSLRELMVSVSNEYEILNEITIDIAELNNMLIQYKNNDSGR